MKRRSFLKLLGSLPAGWGITRIDSEAEDPVEENIKKDVQQEEYDIDPYDPYFSPKYNAALSDPLSSPLFSSTPPDKNKKDMSDKDLWI